MHEDELRRQIAELVADHADHATAPPVAAIRRRGRMRRARQTSTAVLLVAALAAGVVAVQRPLGRQGNPVPVVTRPPGLVINHAPVRLHPNPAIAGYVRARFNNIMQEITVMPLTSGKADGSDWELVAVRGFAFHFAAHEECLFYRPPGPNPRLVDSCLPQSHTDEMNVSRGYGHGPPLLWGLLPEGANRVRLLEPGAPPVEVAALEIGPAFRRRCYIATWTPGIQTVVALDGQGRQLAQARIH